VADHPTSNRVVDARHEFVNGHDVLVTHKASPSGKFQRIDARCARCGSWCYSETTNGTTPDLAIWDTTFAMPCQEPTAHG